MKIDHILPYIFFDLHKRQPDLSWPDRVISVFAAQKDQLFLWLPVFLALGIAAYFSLSTEPPVSLAVMLSVIFASCLVLAYRAENWRGFFLCAFLVSLGFSTASLRSHVVFTSILQKELGPVTITGRIDSIEDLEGRKGRRLVFTDLSIEKLAPQEHPVKIRLTYRGDHDLSVGQTISALARLIPPSPPVIPGGFDFQRYLYFQRIGAVGFIYNQVRILENTTGFYRAGVNSSRRRIAENIGQSLDKETGALATALITGQRKGMTERDREAMRDAGLAHMLAISGLHVGLFSGAIFFFARFLLCCVPGLAVRYPVKKYAAVIAMAGAIFYTAIAGATIPTQRALIMTGIVFLAILMDRSPISLRLVSVAAVTVLLLFPESLLSASFQMSFAAVTSLVLFYDWLRPYWSSWHRKAGAMRKLALYFLGVCFTTVVASLATMPFALFHFQQAAVYSLLSNITAVPILAFLIMPAALLSLIAMPFGLEHWPLQLMGAGIEAVLQTAHRVAEMPGAVLKISLWPNMALGFFVLGMLSLFFLNGRLRILFLLPLATSIFLIIQHKQPDILISSDFKLLAYRNQGGSLMVSSRNKERFARESWERQSGLEEGRAIKWPREGGSDEISCGEGGCRLRLKGYHVSVLYRPDKLGEDCDWADLVLSLEPIIERTCPETQVIDFFDAYYQGPHAIWLTENEKPVIRTVKETRGRRLWSGLNGRSASG